MDKSILRHLPAVDVVLNRIAGESYELPDKYVKSVVRDTIAQTRQAILNDSADLNGEVDDLEGYITHQVKQKLSQRADGSIRPVVNATGIVLHTGLGRAPLSTATRESLNQIAAGYSNLEFDLLTGQRGQRNDHVEDLLCSLTGADSALLVNNNAAAVMLAINELAEGKEAIISRGQLVEIGGSFRIPEVMAKSGAVMVEIGTTNRTHLKDYIQAITDETRLVLVVHTSNYKVEGFTAMPELTEIVDAAHQHHVPVLYDLGSGALIDLEHYNLPHEPLVESVVSTGVDVITFSGDKLIGGPQAGLIVGKAEYVDRMKKNPLTRVLRCDKLIHAAMESTLRTYVNPDTLPEKNMTYRMLTRTHAEMRETGEAILTELTENQKSILGISLQEAAVEAGSGSLPTESIPSQALVISDAAWSADKIMRWMRTYSTPVVGYIAQGRCYFNLRTLFERDHAVLLKAFKELAAEMEP